MADPAAPTLSLDQMRAAVQAADASTIRRLGDLVNDAKPYTLSEMVALLKDTQPAVTDTNLSAHIQGVIVTAGGLKGHAIQLLAALGPATETKP